MIIGLRNCGDNISGSKNSSGRVGMNVNHIDLSSATAAGLTPHQRQVISERQNRSISYNARRMFIGVGQETRSLVNVTLRRPAPGADGLGGRGIIAALHDWIAAFLPTNSSDYSSIEGGGWFSIWGDQKRRILVSRLLLLLLLLLLLYYYYTTTTNTTSSFISSTALIATANYPTPILTLRI